MNICKISRCIHLGEGHGETVSGKSVWYLHLFGKSINSYKKIEAN